ncbi:hypothetical protein D3C86_2026500 [compost metagenome]
MHILFIIDRLYHRPIYFAHPCHLDGTPCDMFDDLVYQPTEAIQACLRDAKSYPEENCRGTSRLPEAEHVLQHRDT